MLKERDAKDEGSVSPTPHVLYGCAGGPCEKGGWGRGVVMPQEEPCGGGNGEGLRNSSQY